MRLWLPLKPGLKYGVSGAPYAFRAHYVDYELSHVVFYPDNPEKTQYKIKWMCSSFSTKYRPQFFSSMKRRPDKVNQRPCKACMLAEVNRALAANRGIFIRDVRGRRDTQGKMLIAKLTGAMVWDPPQWHVSDQKPLAKRAPF